MLDSTPVRGERTPIGRDHSPVGQNGIRIRREGTPRRRDDTPSTRDGTPSRRDGTTGGRDGTSGGRDGTPVRRDDISRQSSWKEPVVIPHTTAASTFVFGTRGVLSVLRAKRRKLYKLYIAKLSDEGSERVQASITEIRNMASEAGISVSLVERSFIDKIASVKGESNSKYPIPSDVSAPLSTAHVAVTQDSNAYRVFVWTYPESL